MKKMLSNIISYINKNKFFIAVMIIGTILLAIQVSYMTLSADDFALKIYSKGGIVAAFKYFYFHYFHWGGGFTPLFVIIIFIFDIKVWEACLCLIIFFTIVLSVKLITHNNNINKGIIASIFWILIFLINIEISRETLFWTDGGIAYVLTTFQLFLYFYYLYSRMFLGISKKYDKYLLPAIAFFTGWSSAQTGALTAIIPIVMMLIKRYLKKEKIEKIFYLSTILGIIGFMIFYFAPGNNARMAATPYFEGLNIIQKFSFRVNDIFGLMVDFIRYPICGVPIYFLLLIGLSIGIGYKLLIDEKNKKLNMFIKICLIIQEIFLVLILVISLKIEKMSFLYNIVLNYQNLLNQYVGHTFSISMIIPYLIMGLVLLSNIITIFYISNKKNNYDLFIFVFSAYLSQFMMIMAPYSPFRTTYICIIFLIFAIVNLFKICIVEKNNINKYLFIIVTILNLYLGIIFLIGFILVERFIKEKNKFVLEFLLFIFLISVSSANNYIKIEKGYKINYSIYNENIKRIEEYKKLKNPKEKKLYLVDIEPQNIYYGFTPMMGTSWVEESEKEYFELDKDVIFIPEKSK